MKETNSKTEGDCVVFTSLWNFYGSLGIPSAATLEDLLDPSLSDGS